MSVITAIKENGVIYMGTDSQSTSGFTKEHFLNEAGYKIVRLENGMLVGFCGAVSTKQTILAIKDVFTLDAEGKLTKRHIVNEIVPKLVDSIEQIGDKKDGDIEVAILLAYKDKMYSISSSLIVWHLNQYGKIGAGARFVDYSLRSTVGKPVKERLLSALKASAKLEESVSGPYVLIDTKNLEYEVFDLEGENH